MSTAPFQWQDGERLIRFDGDALAHVWTDAALLTTGRARVGIPQTVLASAAAIVEVPGGSVPDAASAIVADVPEGRLVAWGGGRVIDTAKAIASARGGSVCAVPTTLSGAEMSGGHRQLPGAEERPRVRPALVLADSGLMTSAPPERLRASAMNALGHAAEALVTRRANPVSTMAGLRAAELIAGGLDGNRPADLALGSILAGYALGSAGLALHHVVCQTIVRIAGTDHAATNSAMLPRTAEALARVAPAQMGALADAIGAADAGLGPRIAELAGGPTRLSAIGVERGQLGTIAEAAAARSELANLPRTPTRDQLLRLLESAW
ncbi:MAG TPA: iron-containing alcohol dehydrogenase [Gaiellales bacterium]|nr:iron-containing alcohol dehydrogenase [Gaiellales bacterium]